MKDSMGTVPDYDGMSVAEFDRTRLWHYRARIVSVHDGDSYFSLCDTGFRGRHEPEIRVADLDAPELWDKPAGPAARDALMTAFRYTGTLLSPRPEALWPLRYVSRQLERVTTEDTSFVRSVGDTYLIVNGVLRNVRGLL